MKRLQYLFDPLCGWCYALAKPLEALSRRPSVAVELVPTGLFAGDGARDMTDQLAAYAWSNDQRIAQLTGQRFSDAYRRRVIADRRQRFDSGPATLALTAVNLTSPDNELAVLRAIHQARYVDGDDVTDVRVLSALLIANQLVDASTLFLWHDATLLDVARARIDEAHSPMTKYLVSGVPSFVGRTEFGSIALSANDIQCDLNATPERIVDA